MEIKSLNIKLKNNSILKIGLTEKDSELSNIYKQIKQAENKRAVRYNDEEIYSDDEDNPKSIIGEYTLYDDISISLAGTLDTSIVLNGESHDNFIHNEIEVFFYEPDLNKYTNRVYITIQHENIEEQLNFKDFITLVKINYYPENKSSTFEHETTYTIFNTDTIDITIQQGRIRADELMNHIRLKIEETYFIL